MAAHDSPESLLDEARWLERMARSLVGDVHTARDLAQDAWLAAHSGSKRIRGERRAWLTGTLRRLAAKAFRTRRRAAAREANVPAPEPAPSAADLTARAEMHERLLANVRRLPEHYRVPLLLRYYDDLPPRVIAERLGLPVRTVHTQLARGLELLRERFDAEHPRGRAGWIAAFLMVPEARLALPAPISAAKVLLVGATALAVVALPLLWWTHAGTTRELAPRAGDTPSVTENHATRSAVRDVVPSATSQAAKDWHGTVIDWEGHPVPGAAVIVAEHLGLRWERIDSGDVTLMRGTQVRLPELTDRDGGFRAEVPASARELRAELAGHLTVMVGIWRTEALREPCIVVAPARSLRGRCVDESGLPLADVSLTIRLPEDHALRSERGTAGLHALVWNATSDARGEFAFEEVPALGEATLEATCSGHGSFTARVADLGSAPVQLASWARTLRGKLLGRDALPLRGAAVATATGYVVTGDDGAFLLRDDASQELWAVAPGLAPERISRDALDPAVLTRPALAIAGVVRSGDGSPLARCEVSLADPTVVGVQGASCVLEAVGATGDPYFLRAITDDTGHFRIAGLAPRAYRLRVLVPETAAWFATEPLQPGTDVTIPVPRDLEHERFRVRFVTASGAPLANARVTVQGPGYGTRPQGAPPGAILFASGADGTTDDAGELVLERVPRRGVDLRVAHPTTGVVTIALTGTESSTAVFTLMRIGELGVRCPGAPADAWVEVLDAGGRALSLGCLSGVSARHRDRWNFAHGRSPLLTVPESAALLRIASPTGEFARVPLAIAPGRRVFVDV